MSARGLWKAYGAISALTDVSIEVRCGEILGVVGDNGAGKSTLVKVLSGAIAPDSGELTVDGSSVAFQSPLACQRAGIATVFQDLALVEPLDVASNLFLGREPRWGPFIRRRLMLREAESQIAALAIRLPSAQTAVGLLSGGQRQGVAVARAVTQGARVIIMDEPTAALGVRETARVAEIIAELREQRRAVIVVSHDLELMFSLTDRIQIMRLGRRAGVVRTADVDRDVVVGLITGALKLDEETSA